MLTALLFALSAPFVESARACEPVAVQEIEPHAPAILVLGERHGDRGDLARAAKIARRLAREVPVTIALEAVRDEHQAALDQLEAGSIRPAGVREAARWEDSWGHDFGAYRKVLRLRGVRFVAAGPKLGPKPAGEKIPVPDAYDEQLREVALAHGMTEEDVPAFSAAQAWRDHRIAELALEGWSGDGVLVIVAGRGHVGGGLGIPWQLREGLYEGGGLPVLLAPSDDCAEGDRFLP